MRVTQPSEIHPSRRLWWAVVGCLLLAFAVALHGVNDLILWADEGWTIYASDPGLSLGETIERVEVDNHPPLFFVELHLWRVGMGSSVFAMRCLSVLLALLSAALLFRVGADMLSPTAAIIAVLLYIAHDLIHVFAQEVRHYPQQQVMTLLVMWLYWRWWRRPDWRRALLFGVAGAALLWSYYWGGFVLLVLALHGLLTRHDPAVVRRVQWRSLAAGLGLAALLFIPWLPTLADQAAGLSDQLRFTWDNSWVAYRTLAEQLGGSPAGVWLALAALGVVALDRKKLQPSAASGLLGALVVLVVAITVVLNEFMDSLYVRSLAVIVPAVMLLVAHAVARFRSPERWIMTGVLLLLSWGTRSAAPPARAQWDDVARYVAQHSTAADVVLLEMNNGEFKNLQEVTFTYYLDQASDGRVRTIPTEGPRVADPAGFAAYLDAQVSGETHVWVVKLGWPYYDLRAALAERGFTETAPVTAWHPFTGLPVKVWRFDRLPDGAAPAVAFGAVMRMEAPEIAAYREWVTVNLLWSPQVTPDRDYTVSVFLLDASGALVTQHDSYPMENRSPTVEWTVPGLYFDSHTLDTSALPAGTYQVGVKVYAFTDPSFSAVQIESPDRCAIDDPAGSATDADACQFVTLGSVRVGH